MVLGGGTDPTHSCHQTWLWTTAVAKESSWFQRVLSWYEMSLRSLRAGERVTSADIEETPVRCFSSGSLEQCPEWQREGRVGSRIPLFRAHSNCFRGLRCRFLFELRKKKKEKSIEKAAIWGGSIQGATWKFKDDQDPGKESEGSNCSTLWRIFREKVTFCLVRWNVIVQLAGPHTRAL